MSFSEEQQPLALTVSPTPETGRWSVTLSTGDNTLQRSEEPTRKAALRSARSLAQEYSVGVTCTLEHFFDLTVEGDDEGQQTFTTSDGFALTWWRAAYPGDRLGLDHLSLEQAGKPVGEYLMYHDTDSDVVKVILQLIAPGKSAAEISGQLT
jgi:hypothetical protein